MESFSFQQPTNLEGLYVLLEKHGEKLKLLAGGTDLTVELRHGITHPDVVVDLKRVADLPATISIRAGELCVGAAVTISELVAHEGVMALYPALVESSVVVGSIQIRNRATLSGNICNASPAADTVPVLAAYGASVVLQSRAARRTVRVVDFVLGNRRIDLAPGELVTEVRIPLPADKRGCAFARLTRRRGVDLATINVACTVSASGESVFALGAAAPRPVVVEDHELVAAWQQSADLRAGIDHLVSVAKPITDIRAGAHYRRQMFTVLAERAFVTAFERMKGR